MTETVHVRHYVERRATLTTYDWQRRRPVTREHVCYVATTQVVEFDDREPVTPWESGRGHGRWQKERRAANIRRAYSVLQQHGPMPRKRLARLAGVALTTVTSICDAQGDVNFIAKDGNALIVGLAGQTYEPRSRYTPTALRIADYLREYGVCTAREVAAGMGLNVRTAGQLLVRYEGDLFDVAYTSATGAGGFGRKHWRCNA